jgi:hypothetical protein
MVSGIGNDGRYVSDWQIFWETIFRLPIEVNIIHFRLKVSNFVNFTKCFVTGRMLAPQKQKIGGPELASFIPK